MAQTGDDLSHVYGHNFTKNYNCGILDPSFKDISNSYKIKVKLKMPFFGHRWGGYLLKGIEN